MPSGLATNLLLAVVSVGITAGAVELGVRAWGPAIGRHLRPTHENCMQRSALLSYEFRPNCAGTLSGSTFQTNTLGLRGPELRANARRILALGDSCTWGWAMPQSGSYPMRLQTLLDERVAAAAFDVINAGVPGYTSYQGLRYLRERGLALHPAIVIISFGFNDQFAAGDIVEQLEMERRYMPVLLLDDFLQDRSMTYRWMRWRAANEGKTDRGARVPADRYAVNLRDIATLALDNGARVLLLSLWSPDGEKVAYRQAVHDLSATLHIPIVEYEGDKMDFVHPTADGNGVLAEQVFQRLRSAGYIP